MMALSNRPRHFSPSQSHPFPLAELALPGEYTHMTSREEGRGTPKQADFSNYGVGKWPIYES